MNEETLFAEALGKQGAARAAFLDEHCKDDVELRKRLEGLLRAHDHRSEERRVGKECRL